MKRLTTSSAKSYRACNRLYKLRVIDGIRGIKRAPALHFGTLWHGMMEVWWDSRELTGALEWLRAQPDVDPYDRAKLAALMVGYHCRWSGDGLAAVAIEEEFATPLRNPATGAPSRTFELAGKKDGVAKDHRGTWLVEHKTSSEDISAGSVYWQKLKMDTQISTYYVGCRANGHDIEGCIYDVVRKPMIKPRMATPIEKRKYRANGELYANLRDCDETPEEYGDRLTEDIEKNPDQYYRRGEVYRLESEEIDAAKDLWQTARAIRDSERLDSWPRNPDACFRWHRECDYWPVCTGAATVDDTSRYERVRAHEELSNNDETTNGANGND